MMLSEFMNFLKELNGKAKSNTQIVTIILKLLKL
jgi:hypothetical protein